MNGEGGGMYCKLGNFCSQFLRLLSMGRFMYWKLVYSKGHFESGPNSDIESTKGKSAGLKLYSELDTIDPCILDQFRNAQCT